MLYFWIYSQFFTKLCSSFQQLHPRYLKFIAEKNKLRKVCINVISINFSFKACGKTSLLVPKNICAGGVFFPDRNGRLLNTQNLVT